MSTQTKAMAKAVDPADETSAGANAVPEGLAEQLVAQAKASGVALTGPGGLLSGLTKQVLETALNAEMTEHLGHEHGGAPTSDQGTKSNVRNGYSAKTVRTEIGDVRIQVPRDRAGSFEPVMVPKHARHLSGFDQAVISL
jgi:putative transposase